MSDNNIIIKDTFLVKPNVHDGLLIGIITLQKGKRQLLLIQKTDNSILCLALSEVERFRVDNFLEGNIIFDITIESGLDVKTSDIAYAHGLEEVTNEKQKTYLNIVVKSFLSNKQLFVQLSSSYGCELVCICRSIEVLENWNINDLTL